MTYGILVLADSLLLAYTIVTYVVVIVWGADCFVNDNKNYPYTDAMVEDPDKYDYASDPKPQNVHNEVKTVIIIFLLAISVNLLSDAAKICIRIDTGRKRRIVNTLKVTHIFTVAALAYGTYVHFSRLG